MKKLLFVLSAALAFFFAGAACHAQQIYVGGGGKPCFNSLEEAKEYIRTVNSGMKEDIVVNIQSGEYTLSDTLKFTSRDSASNGKKIIYRGVGEAKPQISGGVKITGWKLYDADKGIYAASAKGLDSRAFFVNGSCAVRARSKNNEFDDKMRFTNDKSGYVTDYAEMADWKNQTEIELVYSNLWATPRVFVNSITRDGDLAYINPNGLFATINSFQFATMIKTNPLYIENAFELLDEPGEFYIDKSTDTIYYIPRENEDMSDADAVLPAIEALVDIRGEHADKKVSGIVFENVSFLHCDWKFVSRTRGIYDRQANIPMRWFDGFVTGEFTNPGLVNVRYAQGCGFTGCEFSLSAGAGLKYSNAVSDSPITENFVHDVYAGGIELGEVNESSYFSAPSDKKYYTRRNDVINNTITDIGKVYEGSCALFLGYISDTRIEHNEIARTPYSAISLGWGWGTWAGNSAYANDSQGTVIRNVSIKHNYIHNIGIGTMIDGGGIYMLGATGGSMESMNECSENYIRDIGRLAAALYPDEGSTYWRFDKNVIDINADSIGGYDTKVRYVHIHQPTIYHILLNGNYTTTEESYLNGTECSITDTHFVPDRKWNDEALAIIKNAGTQEAYYSGAERPRSAASVIAYPDEINLKSGEHIAAEPDVYNDFCERLENVEIRLESKNPDILEIDGKFLSAKASGKTELVIKAIKDGYEISRTADVYVDDEIEEVIFGNSDSEFIVGDSPDFKVTARTALGKRLSDVNAEYISHNPELFSVDESGRCRITGSGEAVLEVKTDYLGRSKSFYKKFTVKNSRLAELSKYNIVDISNIFDDISSWQVEWGKEKRGSKSIAFQTQGGYALYAGRKFGNEILDFDFTVEADGGWPTILLRSKEMNVNPLYGNTAYFIGLKPDCVELQMFKNSQRYLYYGTIEGTEAIAGEAIKNVYFKFRERNNIKAGAVNEENGTRIIVIINGIQVINYLDTTDNAIKDSGYFGVICYDGNIVLDEPSSRSAPQIEEDKTDIELALESGFIKKEEAAENGAVTKGEFTAFVLRALKLQPSVQSVSFITDSKYKAYAAAAFERGLIDENLLDNGIFDCDSPISREQAASVLINALGVGSLKSDSLLDFSDAADIADWAMPYVKMAVGAGIYFGDVNSFFRPKSALNMMEAAALINRFSEKL